MYLHSMDPTVDISVGKQKVDRIVSDLAERVSSGRIMQTAHSANSELAGYSIVSRKLRK